MHTFHPVTTLERTGITQIRPLVYVSEKQIIHMEKKLNLPVVKSPCPADGTTNREEMKQLLRELERKHDGLRYRIFGAMQRGEVDGFKLLSDMQGSKTYREEEEDE